MAAKRRLRMGVIGLGVAGRFHCETIAAQVPEMELCAVVEPVAEAGRAASALYGVPWFASVAEMLRARACAAVTVATPHAAHADATVACARAGLHVLTEKPLAEQVGAADRMVRAARAAGVALGCILQRRFAAEAVRALELVRSGRLGALRRASLVFTDFRTQAYYDSGTWRGTWRGEGGGVLLNQAPHYLDLFVQLAGRPERVLGRTATVAHRIEVEDQADALLGYAGGASGQVHVSTAEPYESTRIELVGDRGRLQLRDGSLEWEVYGPRGLKALCREARTMWARPQVARRTVRVTGEAPTHTPVFRHFARHVLRGETLRCSGESALASLELANAICLSGWLGREVELPISRVAYRRELERRQASSRTKTRVAGVRHEVDPRMRKG